MRKSIDMKGQPNGLMKLKSLVAVFLMLLLYGNINAQTVIQVGTGTTVPTVGTNPGSGANGASPYGYCTTSGAMGKKLQILYTAAQINAALTAASLPTGVPYVISTTSWDISSNTGTALSAANYTIKMANVTQTNFTSAASPYTGSSSTVFGPSTVNFPSSGTGYQVTNTFSSNFTWDGSSSLFVEVCYTASTPGFIATYGGCRRTATTGNNQMLYNGGASINCSTTTFATAVAAIPNIRMTFSAACTAPATQASNFGFNGLTATQATLTWTRGNGTGGVVVVGRSGAAVSVNPASGTNYSAGQNANFGSGTDLGSNNYVLYVGTGTSVTVTNIPGNIYFFNVYEYNTTDVCYKSPGLSGIVVRPNVPSGLNCNYTSSEQLIAYSPVSATSTIATGTGVTNQNYPSQTFPSGFTFRFNGVSYTSFGVNSNGYIWFGTGTPLASANNPLSNASANLGGSGTIDGIISAFGTALSASTANSTETPSIILNITGVSPNRIVTIQWTGFGPATGTSGLCALFGSTTNVNRIDFQIKLYEDGGVNGNRIEFNYVDQTPWCVDASYSVQVGLRGTSNNEFVNRSGSSTNWGQGTSAGSSNSAVCSFNASTFVHANVAFRFNYQLAQPTVSPSPTASNVCPATTVLLTSSSASNYQWIAAGSLIAGANSQTYTTGISGDHYVVSSGTCISSSPVTTVTINSCGSPPSFTTCPGNQAANTSGSCNATVNYSTAATGTPAPTVTYSFSGDTPGSGSGNGSGSAFNVGTTTVTVTASNGFLPNATCIFDVVISDNQNPTIACPSDISVNNDPGQCYATVSNLGTPVTNDNCGIASTYHSSTPALNHYLMGESEIWWFTVDPSGNIDSCKQKITVTDNELPSITCPSGFSTCSTTPSLGTPLTGDNCAVQSVVNNAPPVFPVGPTNVTWTVTDVNTNQNTCVQQVTVLPTPTASISGGGSICLGSGANVTLSFTGTPPWNYTVSNGSHTVSGSTSNNPENISIIPPVTGSFSYSITVLSDANCSGTGSGTALIDVSTAPPATSVTMINAPTGACSGEIHLITSNVVSGQNIQYSWNTGGGSSQVFWSINPGGPFVPGPFLTSTNQIYAQFGTIASGSSTYNICLQAKNGCGQSNNKCNGVRGIVSTPSSISGSLIQCTGNVNQLYTAAVPVGAQVMNWSTTIPGAVITSLNPPLNSQVSINFPGGANGSLCVTAALNCGGSSTSLPRCISITDAPASPGNISGPAKICPGQTYQFQISSVTNASSYSWTPPTGATIVNTYPPGNTVDIQFPNPYNNSGSSAYVQVYASSICGVNSTVKVKTVTSMVPGTPGNISGQTSGTCNNILQYCVSTPPADYYNWTAPPGVGITGQGNNCVNLSFASNFTSGTISVKASAAGCSVESAPRTLSVAGIPAQPAVITVPFPPCNGWPGNFAITPIAGATSYNWTVPNNGTTLDFNYGTSIDVTWGTGSGVVSVRAVNSCGQSQVRNLNYTPGCRLEDEILNAGELTLQPNPAHDMVSLMFHEQNAPGGISIKITDASGRLIFINRAESHAGLNKIDLSVGNYAKGIYIIQLQSSLHTMRKILAIE